jgi:hypothetical protein
MPVNKPVPRFVPTLTEVVQPGLPITPSPTPIDPVQLAEQVLKLVKPRLEQQLRASLQAVIEQHLRAAAPRMRSELQEAIQTAVSQAIANAQAPKG